MSVVTGWFVNLPSVTKQANLYAGWNQAIDQLQQGDALAEVLGGIYEHSQDEALISWWLHL
jgi:hypothetical protein